MPTSAQAPATNGAQTSVVKYENIADQVLKKVNSFTEDGSLILPKNYSVANNLKSAWLVLQETTDRNGKPVLESCTKSSIANALLDMVLQALSVSKKQGYFIAYGQKLSFQRSYFGTSSLAKRVKGGIVREPVANVIYDGDDFVYSIDVETGLIRIIKHEQKIENINDAKIKGAYAITRFADGSTQTTIMTIDQIKAAWNQGQTKGQSQAHKNFPAEMCKKTVIGRACKMVINSSDDAWLYDGMKDESDSDSYKEQRDADIISTNKEDFAEAEEAGYEEVDAQQAPPRQTAGEQDIFNGAAEGPGY